MCNLLLVKKTGKLTADCRRDVVIIPGRSILLAQGPRSQDEQIVQLV